MTGRRKGVEQGRQAPARAGGGRVIQELETLLAPLAAAAPPVPPPPALWERISAALDAEIERDAAANTLRLGAGDWEPYAPGIARRWLWDRRTFLLRIDAGAVLPAHAHDETEHCLVIQGSLAVGRVQIGPGDYHIGQAGTPHVEIAAPEGAVILVHNTP